MMIFSEGDVVMTPDGRIRQLIDNLANNHMIGYFVQDAKALLKLMPSLIPCGATVGCGDSVTLEQTGVFEFLRQGPYVFLDKHKPGLTSENKREIYLQNFSAHTFVTGMNAVTMDGKLFNIDGNGSRVAPIIYGPNQVIAVVGHNKIVSNIDDALDRARNVAAPLDAKRLGRNTPCTVAGKCMDCKSRQRICNSFVAITGQFDPNRIKVIVVNEVLGY